MIREEIQDILEKMTVQEKAALLSGKNEWQTWDIPRLAIPSVFCSDGPSGLRKQEGAGDHLGLNASVPATCFPSAATVANSWDEELCSEVGKGLGREAKAHEVHILLGPGLNTKRSPLGGRSFEYFSEDPYLSGKLAAAYIRGIQSEGVRACPKHLAVNSQETRRMASNSVLDERTLREVYLTGFEIAVKEGGPKAIMTSYNMVNGVYANENPHILNDILRGEWGYDGLVITDWGGSNDHVQGVKCGSDLEMPCPGLDSARQIEKALDDGTLAMEEVDACVARLLEAALEAADTQETLSEEELTKLHGENHALARRAAAESIVLLKNEEHILPLPAGSKVALIGDFAEKPRFQGAGSSKVNQTRLDTMVSEIQNYPFQLKGVCQGYHRDGVADEQLLMEAKSLAQQADYVIYCFGLDELSESEGQDRMHLRIPENQIAVLGAIAGTNPRVIGVLSAGAPVEMSWAKNCKGLLHGYLSGQAGAAAMLDVLSGRISPSGKLNESVPFSLDDTPTAHKFPAQGRDAFYREGPFVGYRYYETAGVRVQYPFGFGLSYTEFSYADLDVKKDGVSFTITNTGDCDGAEIVQVYVSLPDSRLIRPARELKGFARVYLKSGESKRVSVPLDDKAFRYWNTGTNRWETEAGDYRILVGASCRDIRLTGSLSVEGTTDILSESIDLLPDYKSGKVKEVSEQEFEILLGRPLPKESGSGTLTVNSPICELSHAKSWVARTVGRVLQKKIKKSESKGTPDLNLIFIYNMPFRAIAKMTEGMVSMEMAEGLVTACSGHLFRGLGKVISGFFRNKKLNKRYLESLRKGGESA